MKQSPIKILLIEDNPGDARLVKESLAEAGTTLFEVTWQKDLANGLAHLKKNPIDIILLDLTLPDSAGFDTFKKVNEKADHIPIILLTGSKDDILAAQAVREGAQDYLVKGQANSSLLVQSIRYAIERKQIEELLRENETRYRAIFEGVGDAIFVQTLSGQILEVNQRACEMYGYTHAQFLTKTVADLVPSEKYIISFDQKESPALPTPPIETINVRANGEQFPIELSSSLQKLNNNPVLFVVGRDITERKRMADKLDEERITLRTLIDNLPDRVYVKDTLGRKTLSNIADWQASGGKAMEDVIGKTDLDTYPPELAEQYQALDTGVIDTGIPVINREEPGLDPQRNPAWILTSKIPLLDGNGKVTGLVGIGHDITERKHAEQEIQRRLTDLNVLFESSLALSSQLAISEIGKKVIEILGERLEWHHAVLRIRKEESEELEVIGYSAPGVDQENIAVEINRLNSLISHVGQGLNGWVFQHGEGVRSGNLSADPRYIETFPGMRSGMYAPMIVSQKVIGVIAIESEIDYAFDKHDEQLLATLAKITANAFHRNRLWEQTEYQLQHLAALRTIDQAISGSFDLRVTLDIFIKNAVAQLGVDAALLLIANPEMNTLEYAGEVGFHNSTFKNIHLRLGEGDAGRVVLERRVVSIPNLHQADKPFKNLDLAASENFISWQAAPLITKGQVKGVLEVFSRTHLDPSPDWLGFFETLAGQAAIAIDNNQLFETLQSSNFELAIAYDETIEGWSRAMDLRDQETEGHTQRVTELTLRLANSMGFKDAELINIRRGALLHDIGKMGVPDSILRKPGPLTDEEWVSMRKHPLFAYEMLLPITYLRSALDIPYCHHEKWDGSGYPRGLKGGDIPMAARIFALVDVWDALTSDRPYRKAWSKEKTVEYLREQSGKHFEPRLVEIFLKEVLHE